MRVNARFVLLSLFEICGVPGSLSDVICNCAQNVRLLVMIV